MFAEEDARFRLKLAHEFLNEATAQLKYGFYRSVVDNCQLAVENAVKSVISLFKPVPKLHELKENLKTIEKEIHFTTEEQLWLEKLKHCAEIMGFETHIRTDYGDETQRITPWEMFTEYDAKDAIRVASDALDVCERLISQRIS